MPDDRLKNSFTSADGIPVKLMLHMAAARKLRPIHVQWMPTNRCNLNCPWCSCAERDRSVEMDLPTARKVIGDLALLGCKAATITGGGEPLMHRDLPEMLACFADHGIKIGLVTNGILLDRLDKLSLSRLTWCRISHGDNRVLDEKYAAALKEAVSVRSVDWGLSYLIGRELKQQELRRVVCFANEFGLTHVRVVTDILDPGVTLSGVKEALEGIDDSKVICQDRSSPSIPTGNCWIAYVKPVILPDWRVGPCCGYQYALDPPTRDMPPCMVVGDARDLKAIYDDPKPLRFPCRRCYYAEYNQVLSAVADGVRHEEFL